MVTSTAATTSSSSSSSPSPSHPPPKRSKPIKPPPPQLLIPSLPNELSLEILTRLPIKFLLKFTTVSKSFHSLITSPHFTKSHFSTSLKYPNHPHHFLLHSSTLPHFTLHQTPLKTILQNPVIVPNEITHPKQRPDESLWLVGTVNGVVCIVLDETEIVFWNPCLRKYREVTRLDVEIKRGCFVLYGFGYDDVGEDYKVIAIFCVFKESNVYENEVMVFSGKRGGWRAIEGFKEGVPLNDSGKFVSGKLHWATSPGFELVGGIGGGTCKWSIGWIDVGDESFGELEQPDYGEGKYDLVLGAMGEWICVLGNDGKGQVEFWVMKEYGVRESWSKFASISCLDGPERGSYEPPLYLLNNGKVLLMFGANLVLYDPKDDSRSVLEISDFHACMEGLVYVESLVLP